MPTTQRHELRTTHNHERPSAASVPRWAGLLTIAAGVILLDGVALTAAYRSSAPPVSHDKFSYPWHGATAVATSVLWGLAQAFLVVGLTVFARHASDLGRAARIGSRLAIAGGALFVTAHAVSAIAYDANTDDPTAVVVGILFGLATVLMAIGLLIAGTAVRRSGRWTARASLAPLGLGAWMIAMIPLQFTAALIVAVGIYAIAVIAFGVALDNITAHRR